MGGSSSIIKTRWLLFAWFIDTTSPVKLLIHHDLGTSRQSNRRMNSAPPVGRLSGTSLRDLCHRSTDCQPEPLPRPESAVVELVRTLEDPILGARNKSRAGQHRYDKPLVVGYGSNIHSSPIRRVTCGVLQEIDEQLLQQQAIDVDQGQFCGKPDFHPMIFKLLASSMQSGANDLLQHVPLPIGGRGPRFQFRHLQDVFQQAAKTMGFLGDGLEQLSPCRLVGVRRFEQAAACTGDGGERRLQIVRNAAQKRAAKLFGLGLDARFAGTRNLISPPEPGQADCARSSIARLVLAP